jgi:hypothetical protein
MVSIVGVAFFAEESYRAAILSVVGLLGESELVEQTPPLVLRQRALLYCSG